MYNKVGCLKFFQVLAGKLVQNQNCALETQTILSAIGRRTVMFSYFLLYLILLWGHSTLRKCSKAIFAYWHAVKSKRSRHERDKEFVENNLDVYWCNECSFSARMLSKSQNFVFHNHGQLGGVCDYCHLGFQPPKNFSTHLLTTHGLRVKRAASADLATTSCRCWCWSR